MLVGKEATAGLEFFVNFQFNLATRDTCKESQGKRNPDVTNELLVVIYLTYGIHVIFSLQVHTLRPWSVTFLQEFLDSPS
mgnify:CR=1